MIEPIHRILTDTARIAMVGASARPERPSFGVMRFLIDRGFSVVPVNPGLVGQRIHGEPVVAELKDAGPLDMVELFRASDQVRPFVQEAIRLGARTIWMQLGVIDEAAAAEARAAGVRVVMDRCPKIEWARLGLPYRREGPLDA